MENWKGIAISGIWIGVGIVGLHDTQGWTCAVAVFAFLSSAVVART